MGSSSGKLIIPPTQDQTAKLPERLPANQTPSIETASQPTTDKEKTEQIPDSVESPIPTESNGTVTENAKRPSTTGSEKHKIKSPVGWIKRRLSRKSVSKQHSEEGTDTVPNVTSEDQTPAVTMTTEETIQPTESEVTETAGSLVQEVLSSALASDVVDHPQQQDSVFVESPEEPQATVELQSENVAVDQAEPTEPETPVEVSKPEPTVDTERPIINGDHVETLTDEEPIMDTNNTNAEEPSVSVEIDHDASPINTSLQVDPEAMAAKMAGLELTNGHSEIECNSPTEVTVNGH